MENVQLTILTFGIHFSKSWSTLSPQSTVEPYQHCVPLPDPKAGIDIIPTLGS